MSADPSVSGAWGLHEDPGPEDMPGGAPWVGVAAVLLAPRGGHRQHRNLCHWLAPRAWGALAGLVRNQEEEVPVGPLGGQAALSEHLSVCEDQQVTTHDNLCPQESRVQKPSG